MNPSFLPPGDQSILPPDAPPPPPMGKGPPPPPMGKGPPPPPMGKGPPPPTGGNPLTKGTKKPPLAQPLAPKIPEAPPLNGPVKEFTLRDIAAMGSPSNSFHLAACQSIINSLKHKVGRGGGLSWHTYHFKQMVATILLETVNTTPGDGLAAMYDKLLSWKIKDFNNLRKGTQLAILDKLWRTCYQVEVPSKLASEMMEGEPGVSGGNSLPSSIRRVPGTGFFVRIEAGPVQKAWEKWQIGFRIDGGKGIAGNKRDDLPRVLGEGSKPLQKYPDLAVIVAQKYYHEHACSMGPELYIGYQNRDLYNESGTCVSRSLFGATAFPYRDSQNNTPGLALNLGGNLVYQYLFAFDCAGMRGVDTEKVQVEKGHASLWRPGEKAFAGFPAERILAWTRVVKMGQPKSGGPLATGWSFKFVDSQWTWVRAPGGEKQKFLEDELATWEPGVPYIVPASYDFQTV